MTPGCVVHVTGLERVRELMPGFGFSTLKEVLGVHGEVAFVDLPDGRPDEAVVRFRQPDSAAKAGKRGHEAIEGAEIGINLLEGKEEKEHWDGFVAMERRKYDRMMANRGPRHFKNRRGGRGGGRGGRFRGRGGRRDQRR